MTEREIETQKREHAARGKIAEALRDAQLTPLQELHLLATILAEHTRRLEGREAIELDAKGTR